MTNSNTKTFGYCRVSTTDQNEDRQVEAMLDMGINERDIFIDKCSGKNPAFTSILYKMKVLRRR